jgi:hypothetical protein
VIGDRELLEAVERLRADWPELFGTDTPTVARAVAEGSGGEPEQQRRAAYTIITLLPQHEAARKRLARELGVRERPEALYRLLDLEAPAGYEPPPGGGGPFPPGTLMVCSEPDHHDYQRILQQKGELLLCPLHGDTMVPADSIQPDAREKGDEE